MPLCAHMHYAVLCKLPASVDASTQLCIFCGQDVNNNNLRHHLAKFHWSQCFRCAVCEEQGGLHGEACFTSSAEAEAHARQQHQIYGLELDNVILPPLSLFLITCHFCVPLPRHFLGGPLAALQSQLVLHLPRHEDVHRGRQYIIEGSKENLNRNSTRK